LALIDGGLFLRTYLDNLNRAGEKVGAERERWVNKIPLGSPFYQLEPAWRPQLLGWGLEIARRLLVQAVELCGDARVQTYLWLQPDDPGGAGPTAAITLFANADEGSYGTGAGYLYRVREQSDDPWALPEHDRLHPEHIPQPLMTLPHGQVISSEPCEALPQSNAGRAAKSPPEAEPWSMSPRSSTDTLERRPGDRVRVEHSSGVCGGGALLRRRWLSRATRDLSNRDFAVAPCG